MRRCWKPLAIIGGIVLLAYPWISKDAIYQSIMISFDTHNHSDVITAYAQGLYPKTLYFGQKVFGFILGKIASVLPIAPIGLFVLFTEISLVVAGVTTYFVFSRLVNKRTGILAVLLSMFCANGLIFMFKVGITFDLINMYIILPMAIFFSVRYLTRGKIWYLVGALAMVAIFSIFHLTSIYLPFILTFGLLIYFGIYKKATVKVPILVVPALALNLCGLYTFLLAQTTMLTNDMVSHIAVWDRFNNISATLGTYFINMPSLIACATVYSGFAYRKKLHLTTEVKYLLAILAIISLPLLGGGILGCTSYPDRLMLDGLTYMALFIAVLLGELWVIAKDTMLKTLCIVAISASVGLRLVEWVR
jgi:hypothetical protein